MATEEEKRVDKITEMLSKIPRTLEVSVQQGFDRVINLLKGGTEKTQRETESYYKKSFAADVEDKKRSRSESARDRATQTRIAMKTALELNKGYSEGMMGMQEKLFMGLSSIESRSKGFYERMLDHTKKGWEDFRNMTKGTLKGIISTFTGPFYGLIASSFKVIVPAIGKLGSNIIQSMGIGSLDKFLTKFEGAANPLPEVPVEASFEEQLLSYFKDLRDTAKEILSGQILLVDRVIASIKEAATFISGVSGSTKELFPSTLPVPVSGGILGMGSMGDVASVIDNFKDIYQDKSILYLEFLKGYKEKFVVFEDLLEKMVDVTKKGGGSSLTGTAGGLGAVATGIATWLTKRIPIIGGLAAGAYEAFNVYRGSREAGMGKTAAGGLAAARGATTGAGAYLGGVGGAAAGAAIGTFIFPGIGTVVGGLLGSLAGTATGGAIGHYFGKWATQFGGDLGIKIFNFKEAFNTKFNTLTEGIGIGLFNAKEWVGSQFDGLATGVKNIFTEVGAAFSSSTAYIKDKVNAFIPSGTDIVEALKSVLSALISVGPLVADFATNLGKNASDAAKQTVFNARQLASEFFGRGEKKIEAGGTDPYLREQFNVAAKEYERAGRTTLAESMGGEQQTALNKNSAVRPVNQHGIALDTNTANVNAMKYNLTRPSGSKDSIQRDITKPTTPEERARIKAIKPPVVDIGGFVKKEGIAQVHPAEIVSPIGKFVDMLSRTATSVAEPAVTATNVMDGRMVELLSAIVSGVKELVASSSQKEVDRGSYNPPIPDFPGDPGIIFGGNYFPQKGNQWG